MRKNPNDENDDEVPFITADYLKRCLEELINDHSLEGGSNTPDFILADYLKRCLETFDMCVRRREDWYDR